MEQEMEETVEYILIIKAFEVHGLGTSVEFSPPVAFGVINNQGIESILPGTESSTRWLGA